jgi:hypothetical protein
MKRSIGFLFVAMMAVVLAAPLAAQTVSITASVPFEFMVTGSSMPAGDYTIGSVFSETGSAIHVSNGNSGVVSLVMRSNTNPNERTGQVSLVFHRYGDQYFLSRIVDGSRGTGLELPISRTEKELSKTASLEKFETVTLLARR